MGKVRNILSGIERKKSKVAKFFIICAVLEFFISTLYRIYSIQDSRTLIETTINVYSLLIVGSCFIHEFMKCLLCKSFIENFKIITHYQGKGIIFILISIIYMSHSLGNQQNYSAYLLFAVGLLLIAADCKFVQETEEVSPALEKQVEINIVPQYSQRENNYEENKIEIPKKVASNPYDIPDDF